ncbi:hypothetical protein, partial [Candidatus Hakubella thermalkaliphila]
YKTFSLADNGQLEEFRPRTDIEALVSLRNRTSQIEHDKTQAFPQALKNRISSIITDEEARLRAKFDRVLSVNSQIVRLMAN